MVNNFEQFKSLGTSISVLAYESGIIFERGIGSRLIDVNGNTYIDMTAGNFCLPLGHSHPVIIKEVVSQVRKLINVQDYYTDAKLELLEELNKILPGELCHFVLFSTGAEATEAAIRACISYTKKETFVAFKGAFHGITAGARALGPDFPYGFGKPVYKVIYIDFPNCFRCPLKLQKNKCSQECFEIFKNEVFPYRKEIAGCFIEPLQGAGGVLEFPHNYLESLVSFCKQNGILVVFDEIFTGIGRCGEMFLSLKYNPDILYFAKGLGSGLPVTVVALKEDIMNARPFSESGQSTTTFGGNPLSCKAAYATLKFIRETNLLEKLKIKENIIKEFLYELKICCEFIGDCRGKGMLYAIELVKNKKSLEPDCELGYKIANLALKSGIKLNDWFHILRLVPPLTISEGELIEALNILKEVILRSV